MIIGNHTIRLDVFDGSRKSIFRHRKEMVLRMVEKRGYIVRKNVETELNVSQSTAILLLRDLAASGLLVKGKDGRQMKYWVVK